MPKYWCRHSPSFSDPSFTIADTRAVFSNARSETSLMVLGKMMVLTSFMLFTICNIGLLNSIPETKSRTSFFLVSILYLTPFAHTIWSLTFSESLCLYLKTFFEISKTTLSAHLYAVRSSFHLIGSGLAPLPESLSIGVGSLSSTNYFRTSSWNAASLSRGKRQN